VVDLLRKHFVPFALSNAGSTNMTAAEAIWLKDRGARGSTGGMTIFTAGGQMLAVPGSIYHSAPVIKALQDALTKFKPEEKVAIENAATPVDPARVIDRLDIAYSRLPRAVPRPAKDGLILFVTWKALPAMDAKPEDVVRPGFSLADYKLCQNMLGVDRIWAGKEEATALGRGELPDKLKQRLARHVARVMSFQDEVKSIDLTLRDHRLSGSFLLKNGERCQALGFVDTKDGKVSRFELVVKGMGTGGISEFHGFSTLAVIPGGKKAPVALAFVLANPNDELAQVQPGSSNDLGGGEAK
jgi:hypothetical protein